MVQSPLNFPTQIGQGLLPLLVLNSLLQFTSVKVLVRFQGQYYLGFVQETLLLPLTLTK